ncbi:hypothetical protein [Candidatus Magnetobacterium casense]|uniref:Uncharacterized protein n=1 Tax=Candidatus Magnetobacterium casense TaxID=1455061 RepID=A0ABS6S0S3_9BACT|nr:hypothetical protein [Candidatus Magnetobacterium casensis]MBV6342411.1 hypothetical protein [Candidatus Magnetobacterium casensis]
MMYENAYGIPFGDKLANMIHESKFDPERGCDLSALLAVKNKWGEIREHHARRIQLECELSVLMEKVKKGEPVDVDEAKRLKKEINLEMSYMFDHIGEGYTARVDFYARWDGIEYVYRTITDKWGETEVGHANFCRYYETYIRNEQLKNLAR